MSYQHINRQIVFSNSRFNVYSDTLIAPDTSCINDFLLVSPRINYNNIVGVNVLPFYDNCFWLLQTWRHHSHSFIFQAISGFLETDDNPSAAAIRELNEEAALSCDPSDLHTLGSLFPEPGVISGQVSLFLAHNCYPLSSTPQLEIGTGKLIPLPFDDVFSFLASGPLISSSTVALLYKSVQQLSVLNSH